MTVHGKIRSHKLGKLCHGGFVLEKLRREFLVQERDVGAQMVEFRRRFILLLALTNL
jgi:hypothetical protein